MLFLNRFHHPRNAFYCEISLCVDAAVDVHLFLQVLEKLQGCLYDNNKITSYDCEKVFVYMKLYCVSFVMVSLMRSTL